MSGSRCSACASPELAVIDAGLRDGTPLRELARRHGVGRGVLARHRDHAAPITVPPSDGAEVEPGDPMSAALDLLADAKSERQRLRALESVRRSIQLELRDHSKARSTLRPPDERQLAALAQNVAESWLAYESATAHDVRDRALAGIRSALDALRSAQAAGPGDTIKVTIVGPDGRPGAVLEADRALWEADIPEEYRGGGFGVSRQLHFNAPATITVTDADGQIVWESLAPNPSPIEERRPLVDPAVIAHDPPSNGHGHV